MRGFGRQGRTLLLAAMVVCLFCMLVCGGGNKDASSGKSEQGAVSGKSGKLTDNRDGQKYKTVKIGNQVWMAENLRFKIGDSWCYDNSEDNCAKYGRLYDWNTAMKACPSGWHLPSDEEWDNLVTASGGGDGVAGMELKSASGWDKGNGYDRKGFSALPGGARSTDGNFYSAGKDGNWWTATEFGSDNATRRDMIYDKFNVYKYVRDKGYGYSVRCVQD